MIKWHWRRGQDRRAQKSVDERKWRRWGPLIGWRRLTPDGIWVMWPHIRIAPLGGAARNGGSLKSPTQDKHCRNVPPQSRRPLSRLPPGSALNCPYLDRRLGIPLGNYSNDQLAPSPKPFPTTTPQDLLEILASPKPPSHPSLPPQSYMGPDKGEPRLRHAYASINYLAGYW